MKKLAINCVVFFALASVAAISNAQNRTTPECFNEQLSMSALQAALANPNVATGAAGPPGVLNMTGPFQDPLFSAAGWEKREWTSYFRDTFQSTPISQVQVQRYTVQIHYMWNYNTRISTQIKFKTTSQQGCVGVTVPLGSTSSSGGSDPTPPNLTPGYSAVYIGTTHFRVGSVTSGPLVVVGTPSLSWGGGGGGGGGGCGVGGRYCPPQLLERTQPPSKD